MTLPVTWLCPTLQRYFFFFKARHSVSWMCNRCRFTENAASKYISLSEINADTFISWCDAQFVATLAFYTWTTAPLLSLLSETWAHDHSKHGWVYGSVPACMGRVTGAYHRFHCSAAGENRLLQRVKHWPHDCLSVRRRQSHFHEEAHTNQRKYAEPDPGPGPHHTVALGLSQG